MSLHVLTVKGCSDSKALDAWGYFIRARKTLLSSRASFGLDDSSFRIIMQGVTSIYQLIKDCYIYTHKKKKKIS